MNKVLITGGTVFVSKYIAEYYVRKGYDVYVLNRNTKEQPKGVTLINTDRHNIGNKLKNFSFDIVIDTAYSSYDIETLFSSLGNFKNYIFISSSAVYPEYAPQPFKEETKLGVNKYWGEYGINKIQAEAKLLKVIPNAYIIRPPYLYGPMNNIYREAFVFDCALSDRKFYLPKTGNMKLQFFYIDDLCRFIDEIIKNNPTQHIFNVGNKDTISIYEWVKLCYNIVGKKAEFINIYEDIEQRNYFCFHDYEYYLDTSKQYSLMKTITSLEIGLNESFKWYKNNSEKVNKKNFFNFIENNFV